MAWIKEAERREADAFFTGWRLLIEVSSRARATIAPINYGTAVTQLNNFPSMRRQGEPYGAHVTFHACHTNFALI